jgi:hypothetical protein
MWPSAQTGPGAGRTGRGGRRAPCGRARCSCWPSCAPSSTSCAGSGMALGQAERVRDLDAAPPGEVAIEVELLLELEGLVPGVRGPLALRLAVRVHRTCNAPMRDSRLAC